MAPRHLFFDLQDQYCGHFLTLEVCINKQVT
jgi:hypothetical protein